MDDRLAIELAGRVVPLFAKELVLFAGAGVGKRANLPDWDAFLGHLVNVAADYEHETAELMRKRISQDRLADAAHLYKTCPLIPEGERWAKLVSPFAREKYDADLLRDLASLPFRAVVTTNYDLSIHDAVARVRGKVPRPLELGDPTLRQGPYLDDFYVARIHGRAELATSIVIATDDYARVGQDQDYLAFLVHVLCRRSCLFLGFSFHDPAIRKVLDVFADRAGPMFPRLHAAILPADSAALVERLERYNIAVLTYPKGRHDVVWEAVGLAAKQLREAPPTTVLDGRHDLFDSIRRFLASCYARLRLAKDIQPLRSLVLEGVALAVLAEGPEAKSRPILAEQIRVVLKMTKDEVEPLVAGAVDSLLQRRVCVEDESGVRLREPLRNVLAEEMNVLVSGVVHRLVVREAVLDAAAHRGLIATVLEEMLLERGWDAAAHFAAAHAADSFDVLGVVRQAITRHSQGESARRQEQIAKAVYQLVANPNDEESRILIEIGRLSFGIDMAIERTHGGLLWSATLPNRLYLDASVLLPLIVPGHPKTDSYVATLKKLEESARWSGVELRLVVATPFLNEVISHRRLSRQIVKECGLENPRRLEEHVKFGMGGENVFVAAYATRVKQTPEQSTFDEFLKSVAPYETEEALQEFLEQQAIQVVKLAPRDLDEGTVHNSLRMALHAAYDEGVDWKRSGKPNVLIDHEALQLWQLEADARRGVRSLFVTADERFRRIVAGARWSRAGGLVLSPLAVIQLVDLLVGVKPEGRSLARVMWAVRALPETEALREYLTDKGLEYYFGEAYAQGVPELVTLVDGLTREAAEAAEQEKISFRPVTAAERQKTLTFLDAFENRFYERMAKEIKRRDA